MRGKLNIQLYVNYKLRIIILSKGFYGLNVFNIISDEEYNIDNYKTIYLLLINDNHFDYLNIILKENDSIKEKIQSLDSMCNNNLKELEKIRKREFPLCLKWYPDIYNEMYCYFKYKIIPK